MDWMKNNKRAVFTVLPRRKLDMGIILMDCIPLPRLYPKTGTVSRYSDIAGFLEKDYDNLGICALMANT